MSKLEPNGPGWLSGVKVTRASPPRLSPRTGRAHARVARVHRAEQRDSGITRRGNEARATLCVVGQDDAPGGRFGASRRTGGRDGEPGAGPDRFGGVGEPADG